LSLEPILPFLRARVEVESVSMGTPDHNDMGKKVYFSAFDASAVQPPVDRHGVTSAEHQRKTIHAMLRAKEQLDILVVSAARLPSSQWDNGNYLNAEVCVVVQTIKSLISFLKNNIHYSVNFDDTNMCIVDQCAIAIGCRPKRVIKVMGQCQQELELIMNRIDVGEHAGNSSSLPIIENRLVELLGQRIRYLLRRLQNGPPPRLSHNDTGYDQRCQNFSGVIQYIQLELPPKCQNVAVSDECISALVSTALYHITECFGVENLLDPTFSEPALPHQFISQTELNFHVRPHIELDECQMQKLRVEINYACLFLAATRACKFLVDLWTIPGVQTEIERQGGWSEVEEYAAILWKKHLWKICPDDAHLVLLNDFQFLLERLKIYLPVMEQRATICESDIVDMIRRFRLNTKSANVLGKFRQIPIISLWLDEGKERFNNIPVLSPIQSSS